jgi:carboxymethylenebutenolidase
MTQYTAMPDGNGRHPGVVVVHEWWGLNDQMKSIADRWAKEGFIAVVPDLYDGKVVPIGKGDEAAAAMNALDFPKAVKALVAAVAALKADPRCTGKVSVTGYCMGGALSFATSTQASDLAAVVPFYGVPPGADFSKITAPVQAHFAQHDDWATVAKAKEVQAIVGPKMELHVYDAQHAFCNDQRPEVYNATACAQAWSRAVQFVRDHSA